MQKSKMLEIEPMATGMTFAERYAARTEAGEVKLAVGDNTMYDKTFTPEDSSKFSKLTMNRNPLHDVDDDTAAKEAGFDGAVIHGMFTASIFSAAIGAYFPGSIAFDMNIRFSKPVYVNGTVTGIVTVKKVLDRKKLVKCTIAGVNQRDELCVTGGVTLLVRNLQVPERPKKAKAV